MRRNALSGSLAGMRSAGRGGPRGRAEATGTTRRRQIMREGSDATQPCLAPFNHTHTLASSCCWDSAACFALRLAARRRAFLDSFCPPLGAAEPSPVPGRLSVPSSPSPSSPSPRVMCRHLSTEAQGAAPMTVQGGVHQSRCTGGGCKRHQGGKRVRGQVWAAVMGACGWKGEGRAAVMGVCGWNCAAPATIRTLN